MSRAVLLQRPARPLHSLLMLLVVITAAACLRTSEDRQAPSAAALREDVLRPYPLGRWRMAPHELHETVQTLSHILIAHSELQATGPMPMPAVERPMQRPVQRTREEARALAKVAAERARRTPTRFAELAREYSDDLASAPRGGSLGTWNAAELPPPFLDALSELKPGQTSRVVESADGFHVLYARVTPPEAKVAARRIVVGYRGTAPFAQRAELPVERSRSEAELLAKRIAAEAAAQPGRFAALMGEYSEHADVMRGGDFGSWSTYEPANRQREIEVISALEIGGVSQPVESFDGFSIFQRTEGLERAELAASFVRVHAGEPGIPAAKPADVRSVLKGRHQEFDALQAKFCCRTVERWQEGRGDPRMERLIMSLEIGGVAPELLDMKQGFFHLYRREPPAPTKPQAALTATLPTPSAPDVDTLVAQASRGTAITTFLTALRKTLGDAVGLDLDPQRRKRVSEILDGLAEQVASLPPEQRLSALNDARQKLRAVLSPTEFAALQANVRSELTRGLMGAR